jgi:hypothetical protein
MAITISIDTLAQFVVTVTRDYDAGADAQLSVTYTLTDAQRQNPRTRSLTVPLNATQQTQLNNLMDAIRTLIRNREAVT